MRRSAKERHTWKVYMHTSPSGKKYIGITSVPLRKRWSNGRGYIQCTYFYHAIQKYGWDNIQHELLEDNLSFQDAVEKEKYYIQKFNSNNPEFGYNLNAGGEGNFGHPASEETKMLMSRNRQGANAHGFGHKPSEYSKYLTSEALKGREFSQNAKDKMSKEKNKAVYQYDLSGNLINEFESATEASKMTGVNRGNLAACCRYINKNAGGYLWLYEKITNPEIILKYLHGEIFVPSLSKTNNKLIKQYDLDNNFLRYFTSIKLASEISGVPAQQISYCCKHPNAVGGTYRWRYV